ncbi:Rho GTPase-activating protein 11A [Nymphon striatum]|nr:Rho GTPase-activating protein 11A [Nymphon striatum]
MFITEADNIDAIRRQIISELNGQFKVKLKEKRILNQIRQSEEKTLKGENVFGANLGCTKKVTVDQNSSCILVPRFLDLVLKYLEDKIKTEFILRKGGSTGRQRVLRKEIEQTEKIDTANVHDVASLLKQWLRELKEPLIPAYLQDVFVMSNALSNSDQNLLNSCLLLPLDHLQTLRFLLQFLNKVASHSDNNKMDASNLCIVMTPNIMPCDEKSDSKFNKDVNQLLKERRAVINALMNQADNIGDVPKNLLESVNSNGNILKNLEDEFEKSDNSLLSSSRSIHKRRKKRKSLVSELRKKLATTNGINTRSKESSIKGQLTPGPKRKADMNLSTVLPKKTGKEWEKSSTPKGIVKTIIPHILHSKKPTNFVNVFVMKTFISSEIGGERVLYAGIYGKQMLSGGITKNKCQYQCFTPANAIPKIQFTDTPVNEMNFSSSSGATNGTPYDPMRRRRGSNKSGCFRTPKSKSRQRSVVKSTDSMVASRLAGEADNFSICSVELQESLQTVTLTLEPEDDNVFKDNPSESKEEAVKREELGSETSLKYKNSVRNTPLTKSNLQKKGSLMRGRPNTIRTGLPSPYRQPCSTNSAAASHHIVITDVSLPSSDIQNQESSRNHLNRSTAEPMEIDSVEWKSSLHIIPNIETELSNLMDTNSFSDSKPVKRLQRKSLSTPDVTNYKKTSLRKSYSSRQITSYTGAKFAPLSKETAEILTNIGEMVDNQKTKSENYPEESKNPMKWTSGEKYFEEKLQIQENESTTKRESVMRIQRDNAGNVRANVNKFNDITISNPKIEFKTPVGLVPRTPRRRSKRGQKTPVRIPSVFVRNSAVSTSLRNRYHNHEINRKASLRGEPTFPLTSFVKQVSIDSSCKIYHSSDLTEISKSPLRDSNIANMKMSSRT